MDISTSKNTDLDSETRAEMFHMYARSYAEAGEELWFKTADEMFRCSCSSILVEKGSIVSFALFQQRPLSNKICLVAHDSTPEGKKYALQLRNDLCRIQGWFLEASGAPAWILRSKLHTPYVQNVSEIKNILSIPETEDIVLNEAFEPDVSLVTTPEGKQNGHYFHRYYSSADRSIMVHSNHETLFGTALCNTWSDNSCQRECANLLLTTGRR